MVQHKFRKSQAKGQNGARDGRSAQGWPGQGTGVAMQDDFLAFFADPERAAAAALLQVFCITIGMSVDFDVRWILANGAFHDGSP